MRETATNSAKIPNIDVSILLSLNVTLTDRVVPEGSSVPYRDGKSREAVVVVVVGGGGGVPK